MSYLFEKKLLLTDNSSITHLYTYNIQFYCTLLYNININVFIEIESIIKTFHH